MKSNSLSNCMLTSSTGYEVRYHLKSWQMPPHMLEHIVCSSSTPLLLSSPMSLSALAALNVFHNQQSCFYDTAVIVSEVCECDCLIFWHFLPVFIYLLIIHILLKIGDNKPSFGELALAQRGCRVTTSNWHKEQVKNGQRWLHCVGCHVDDDQQHKVGHTHTHTHPFNTKPRSNTCIAIKVSYTECR